MTGQVIRALPTLVDLLLYAGDDFYIDVTVVDAAGNPIDLTGATAQSQIRDDSDAIVGEFVASVHTDTVRLYLDSVTTAALPAAANWDVQITDDQAIVTTLAYGRVRIRKEVTR